MSVLAYIHTCYMCHSHSPVNRALFCNGEESKETGKSSNIHSSLVSPFSSLPIYFPWRSIPKWKKNALAIFFARCCCRSILVSWVICYDQTSCYVQEALLLSSYQECPLHSSFRGGGNKSNLTSFSKPTKCSTEWLRNFGYMSVIKKSTRQDSARDLWNLTKKNYLRINTHKMWF